MLFTFVVTEGDLERRGDLGFAARRVFADVPTIAEIVAGFPGDEMKVQVRNDLSGNATLVHQQIESVGLGHLEQSPADLWQGGSNRGSRSDRQLRQTLVVLTRNQQKVAFGKRADVEKRKD